MTLFSEDETMKSKSINSGILAMYNICPWLQHDWNNTERYIL